MATLEKRIEVLEQASPTDNMGPMFIHFVGMGQSDREIQRITQGNQEWQRQPDESEQDLKDRAQGQCQPNPKGIRVFLCY